MPSSRATSSSAGVISTDFKKPRTSVNHSRTKRTPRSSTVRNTYSSWRSMRAVYEACAEASAGRRGPVTERSQSSNGREIAGPEHSLSVTPGTLETIEHRMRRADRRHSWRSTRGLQGGVHLDRRHRAHALGCASKTKVLADGADLPIWGFDGSSTNQAPGSNSDCVLKPVFSCPDPIRGGDDKLVMCEVLLPDMTPHVDEHARVAHADRREVRERTSRCSASSRSTRSSRTGRPHGFPDGGGFPAPQGFYYCGIGADEVYGRDVVEAHLDACIEAGLGISGINAEVMPGQWEFQVGPLSPARGLGPTLDGALTCCTASPRTSASRRRSTRSR